MVGGLSRIPWGIFSTSLAVEDSAGEILCSERTQENGLVAHENINCNVTMIMAVCIVMSCGTTDMCYSSTEYESSTAGADASVSTSGGLPGIIAGADASVSTSGGLPAGVIKEAL